MDRPLRIFYFVITILHGFEKNLITFVKFFQNAQSMFPKQTTFTIVENGFETAFEKVHKKKPHYLLYVLLVLSQFFKQTCIITRAQHSPATL